MLKSSLRVVLASLALPVMLSVSSPAAAQMMGASTEMKERIGGKDKFAIGLDLGYPFNGLMFSAYANERNQIQLEVGYHAKPGSMSLMKEPDTALGFRGMYLGYPVTLFEGAAYTVPFYVGVGASYAFNVQTGVGWFADNKDDMVAGSDILSTFIPLGLQFRMRNAPVSLFAQFEPAVEFVRAPGELLRGSDVNFAPRLGLGGALHF